MRARLDLKNIYDHTARMLSAMDLSISYQYLVDPDDARAALAAFTDQPIIGLDTETFWDWGVRQNRLSLLQLAAPTGEIIVIDALTASVEEARSLIENPAATMAAHNARFDDGVLREAGFAVAGLIDTLRLARRTLRLRSFSLASVAEHLFGLALDKSYQRSDWRRRPLSHKQLDYAALDAQIALRVYQELTARLEGSGRLHDELKRARIGSLADESESVINRKSRMRRQSVELRPLNAEEQQAFDHLKRWRKQLSESEHIPAYLICPDKTLEHLVIARPTTIEELADIFGLGPSKIARYGAELLDQVRQSCS
jgi:ribonuclease D